MVPLLTILIALLLLTLHDIYLGLGGQVQVNTSTKQDVRLNGKVIAVEGQYH